ncbi:MAG: AAA family ATPase [Thiolinea sp.]
MNESADRYSVTELMGCTDAELLRRLKTSWGYSEEQAFKVIGQLKRISNKNNGSTFFILDDLRSANDGAFLRYPLYEPDVHHTAYVGSVNNIQFDEKSAEGKLVQAQVELSPKKERIKHDNPFSLKVVDSGVQLLQAIPDTALNIYSDIDGKHFIEQWVFDFYRMKHSEQIKKEDNIFREELQQERDQIKERISGLQVEEQVLKDKLADKTQVHSELTDELAATRNLLHESQIEFNHQKKTLERQLNTLNQFIEQKANILLKLDLVDKAEVDAILGRGSEDSQRVGHDFEEVFESDVAQLISYVQAYLWNKGIVYSRKVLEDFYALLTTHDLIVLAGDSGSGKTNLVKSFADAIGGEAVIVPVKPNWTSAEDLLGYYNPLEQKYLSTPFLDALFEAARNPDVPYLICLDEMNLARVEYYFADFLSLLEERGQTPEIPLYSDKEAGHLVSEATNFLKLVDEAKAKFDKTDVDSFFELLRDEGLNAKLHELCGFREGDSLLKYHSHLRKLMSSYLSTPSAIRLPANVRIIGAINVDETTHYLSPKILDRAHIMRFASPLLADWSQVEAEVEHFDLDLDMPIRLKVQALGERAQYPAFDRNNPLIEALIHIVREYLEPLGIEFGLRTVRQALHYILDP